jgi:hypothetical protein
MRREDYEPPTTPKDSPFRRFTVSCLKCGSFKLRAITFQDHESGETKMFLTCTRCRERELIPLL